MRVIGIFVASAWLASAFLSGRALAAEASGSSTNRPGPWPSSTVETARVHRASESDSSIYGWTGERNPSAQGDRMAKVPAGYRLDNPSLPAGMAWIPPGLFLPGRGVIPSEDSSDTNAAVRVREFLIDICEVPGWLWTDVRDWATNHGYSDISPGQWGACATGGVAGADHPVVLVSWYDCVKWCNARSEMEGLVPVYYTDVCQWREFRTGTVELTSAMIDANATGYRLPTEVEWEMAARGGRFGSAYPWGDSLERGGANSMDSGDPFDNGTTPTGYYDGRQRIDGEAAAKDMMNEYGLMDMAGNVYEWCWDPFVLQGAEDEGDRIRAPRAMRGGSWRSRDETRLMCGYRNGMNAMRSSDCVGFRCVRRR